MKSARVLKSAKLYPVTNVSFVQNNYNTSPLESNNENNVEKRVAQYSPSGFLSCLLDNFTSDGNRKTEINLPENFDLSIQQSKGFSIFFWINVSKITTGVHRFIVKRGNFFQEITPSFGFLPNGTTLFVKILTSKHKTETLYSSKEFEINKWYNICATFSIDYTDQINVLTDISLYIDGMLDSQITVPGEPIHNQGNLQVGKVDNSTHGFIGKIVDIILVLRILGDYEINYIFNSCVLNADKEKMFMSYEIFENKLERDILIEKYSKFTNIPLATIEKLNLSNEELREIVKKYDEEIKVQNESKLIKEISKEEKQIIDFKEILGNENSDNYINIKNLAIHAKFINTAMFLSSNLSDELEIKRFLQILEILGETVFIRINDQNIIKSICSIIDVPFPKIKLSDFFRMLRELSSKVIPDFAQIISGANDHVGMTSKNIELHENLLMSSQNFKYVDDFENELAAASITMRSLYSRTKSGRPQTTKGLFSPSNIIPNDEDLISQQFHNFEENKNQNEIIYEIEEDDINKKSGNSPFLDHQLKDSQGRLQNVEEENKKENNDNQLAVDIIIDKKENNEVDNQTNKQDNIAPELPKNEPEDNAKKEPEENNQNVVKEDSKKEAVKEEVKKEEVKKEELKEEKVENAKNNAINESKKLEDNKSQTIKQEEFQSMTPIKSPNKFNNSSQTESPANKQISQEPKESPVKEKEEALITNNNNMNTENNESEINKIILDVEPKFDNDWADGEFEIVILHCFDCHKHKSTTRHDEIPYVDKFNNLGDEIKSVFPNIKIFGNYEKPNYLGSFDVYIRGIGTNLDDKGRLFLYKKLDKGKFPTKEEILDQLIALCMLYGSSKNLEVAQKQFLKSNEGQFPIDKKTNHLHPMDMPEMAQKIKEENEKRNQKLPAIDPDRTKFVCLNWGCAQTFVQSSNGQRACRYHPGVWQFGSYHAYWPEAWTCCEKPWNSEGCMVGLHKGVRLEKRVFLCINHGESNPKSKKPDSACGTYFTSATAGEGCKYHEGFINPKSNRWSCCDKDGEILEGCLSTGHKSVDWPEEEAKLYFYPKPVNNPGIRAQTAGEKKQSINHISKLVAKCDFFKPIQPYETYGSKFELMKLKKEREKEELRLCLNWACCKNFKDVENTDSSCRYHPGKWDHGSTGTKMVEFIKEMRIDPKNCTVKKILWTAHWTCCRKGWGEKGCQLGKHRGPVLANIDPASQPYKWPDPRVKLYFPKVVTDKWKESLKKHIYSEQKVTKMVNKFWENNPKPMVSDLPPLCDDLRLYLLIVSDNIEYQLKFMDIVKEENSVNYFVENNFCNKNKFLKWWFGSYEKIIEEVYGNSQKEIK